MTLKPIHVYEYAKTHISKVISKERNVFDIFPKFEYMSYKPGDQGCVNETAMNNMKWVKTILFLNNKITLFLSDTN